MAQEALTPRPRTTEDSIPHPKVIVMQNHADLIHSLLYPLAKMSLEDKVEVPPVYKSLGSVAMDLAVMDVSPY